MQVSRADGDLQGAGYTDVRGGGYTHESGVAIQSGEGTTALAIVAGKML